MAAFRGQNLSKRLRSLILHQFAPTTNWLCFANCAPTQPPVSDFDIRASDFRAKPGDWLCFSTPFNTTNRHTPWHLLHLGPFARPPNWLCFAHFYVVTDAHPSVIPHPFGKFRAGPMRNPVRKQFWIPASAGMTSREQIYVKRHASHKPS